MTYGTQQNILLAEILVNGRQQLFAQSIESGRRCEELPCFRDAAIASEYAWKFIHDARTHDLPAIGDLRTLQQIRERRRTMKNGYASARDRISDET